MLKDRFFEYRPSASNPLRERGNVVDGSYFVAKGKLQTSDGSLIDCEFEAAHMESGIAWGVAYIKFSDYRERVNPHMYRRWYFQKQKKLRNLKAKRYLNRHELNAISSILSASRSNLPLVFTYGKSIGKRIHARHVFIDAIKGSKAFHGKDNFQGGNVTATINRWVNIRGDESSEGLRIVFMLSDFQVDVSDQDDILTHYHFELINLPISDRYSPKSKSARDQAEYEDKIAETKLKEAIDKAFEYFQNDSSIDHESFDKKIREAVKIKEEDLIQNAGPIYSDFMPIKLDDAIIARLYWANKFDNRSRNTEPTARLFINATRLPIGWSPIETAEWICATLSLCVGRSITWNSYFLAPRDQNFLPPLRFWRSGTPLDGIFVAFTEDKNYLHTWRGLDADSFATRFVEDVLKNLFVSPAKDADEYLAVLESYIFYSASAHTDQQRCTLLCATVEYLYHVWDKLEQPVIFHEFESPLSGKIVDAVHDSIEPLVEDILPKRDKESAQDYTNRQKQFIRRMDQTVLTNLTESFKHRLKWLLSLEGWYTDTSIAKQGTMGHRAEEFVDSRNKLFHEHRFFHDDPKKHPDLRIRSIYVYKEIKNIELFVPILLATVLQYEGRFWDSVQQEWSWMPTLPI